MDIAYTTAITNRTIVYNIPFINRRLIILVLYYLEKYERGITNRVSLCTISSNKLSKE